MGNLWSLCCSPPPQPPEVNPLLALTDEGVGRLELVPLACVADAAGVVLPAGMVTRRELLGVVRAQRMDLAAAHRAGLGSDAAKVLGDYAQGSLVMQLHTEPYRRGRHRIWAEEAAHRAFILFQSRLNQPTPTVTDPFRSSFVIPNEPGEELGRSLVSSTRSFRSGRGMAEETIEELQKRDRQALIELGFSPSVLDAPVAVAAPAVASPVEVGSPLQCLDDVPLKAPPPQAYRDSPAERTKPHEFLKRRSGLSARRKGSDATGGV
eukprot:Hpha_TRINITY_DN15035_c4_g5::TRINITY_DN15035_c4_g5_i1::g.123101::m.123101